MIIFHPAVEGEADVLLICHNDFYRCLFFWTVQRKPGLQVNCPDEVGADTLKTCKFSINYDQCMEEEIHQVKQELTEYIDKDFDSMSAEEQEILYKDRKDLIHRAFKSPIHT